MSVSRLFRWLSFPAGEDCASDPRQFFCCPPVLDTGDLTLRPMQMADAKDSRDKAMEGHAEPAGE